MDHKASYAHHIAQAIRHKKAMAEEEKEPLDEQFTAEDDLLDAEPSDEPDVKAARRERLKDILSR